MGRIGVRTIEPIDLSALLLDDLEGVIDVERHSDTQLDVGFNGDDHALNRLLRAIDSAGSRVVSFTASDNPIETFYLSMIKESR